MASKYDMFVRLDMEDHRVTEETIQIVVALHEQGLTNVGTVLQGRLFRSLNDIDSLDLLSIVSEVEDKFKIRFNKNNLKKIKDFKSLEEIITRLK